MTDLFENFKTCAFIYLFIFWFGELFLSFIFAKLRRKLEHSKLKSNLVFI